MALGEPRVRWRVGLAALSTLALVLLGIWALMKPLPNSCIMTYMYPTYVPVPSAPDSIVGKYGLFLYHEGWRKIDFTEHLRGLSGVPVLFIPGNGGSYKQVRSLAAESDRAYNGGPMEETFYRESTFSLEEAGLDHDNNWGDESWDSHVHVRDLLADPETQAEYVNRLDWFAVDLEGEHSALDGRILEEHTEYVVQAVHRILDQYRESLRARTGNKKMNTEGLPTSVILVGHSMGGFVARAAVVNPKLRKGAVETVLTLSSPHLVAPVAFQPSLGHFVSRVNKLWREGYGISRTRSGRLRPDLKSSLSQVIVVSVPGGVHDYQVRSRMASLDGIVPATNSLTVNAPGMLNTWLSTEHQTILWCNQLVVQVSHTLLKLIDKNTGQAFVNPRTRLAIFVAKFRSALTQTFDWVSTVDGALSISKPLDGDAHKENGVSSNHQDLRYACGKHFQWEGHEKDLHVDGASVTVLAMDGRRRWLDIQKQASQGKDSFVLVTNLLPCQGIRVHLWPEKSKSFTEKPLKQRVVEVTTRMVQTPSGPAPKQIEPGGQTEQAPASGILRLTSKDLEGFRYMTISIAPRPTVSGRPPPATSMAVGQFFGSHEGSTTLSPGWLVSSAYKTQSLELEEMHPLVMNLSVSISLSVFPLSMDIKTTSCGISDSTLAKQQAGDSDVSSLCKLRCFPPLALVWDPYSGLEVFPNLQSQILMSDSSPIVGGSRYASHQTGMIVLVDPHCGYRISVEVAKFAAITRFFLAYGLQIGGFMVAVVLFALMRQARAWELDAPIPSVFACLERNLMFPLPFLTLCMGPLFLHFTFATYEGAVPPPYLQSAVVAVICYVIANGIMALLAMGSMAMFHAVASLDVFLRRRWSSWSSRRDSKRLLARLSSSRGLPIVRRIISRTELTVGAISTLLLFFVHPALGLMVLNLWHVWRCHVALRSYRHKQGGRQHNGPNNKANATTGEDTNIENGQNLRDSNGSAIGHLESFKFFQGLLLLHLAGTSMLVPSLVAWIQIPKVDSTLLWCSDSVLSLGIILHGLCADLSFLTSSTFRNQPVASLVYGLAGLYTYWTGLVLSPYRVFYALASIGLLTAGLRLLVSQKPGILKARYVHKHS